jgi:hypothetical protein
VCTRDPQQPAANELDPPESVLAAPAKLIRLNCRRAASTDRLDLLLELIAQHVPLRLARR